MTLDLTQPTRLHLVGIGGAGMSAIATVLAQMGHEVSGSDLKDSATIERLRGLGVNVAIGHDARNVEGVEHVGISSAVAESNVEVAAARRLGIAVHPRAELLAAICATRRTAAVSGTHGKTTTSSMLALILVEAGLSPSFVIGGEVNEIGTNAAYDVGEWLVVEADESDGTFLKLPAEIAVVTSVEPDHLEHFGSVTALASGFSEFLENAGAAVVCADDRGALAVAPPDAVTYGFSEGAAYRIGDFSTGRAEIAFSLTGPHGDLGRFTLPVPGAHNARNAAGALAASQIVGADPDAARRALARFAGVARRFQFRGEANGVTFVDDYAHLPGEVAATLAAAKGGGWSRIVAVFQPHRYSRTESVGRDFGEAFVDADVVVITGIYGAGEAPRPGVSAKLVLDAVLDAHPETTAAYFPDRAELLGYLRRILRPGDCCLTLSAGDLTSLPDELLATLPELMPDALDLVAERLGALARRDEPIGARTTYRVGGAAALFAEIVDEEGLERVGAALADSGVPLLVLGKGSNLLVADGGFDGLCVTLGGTFEELSLGEAAATGPGVAAEVTAGGGLAYPVLARRLAGAGLGGMSWAVGVPGSVGGAVAMNAGGHGAETADRLVTAEVLHLDSGERRHRPVAELELAYRHSAVGPRDLVLGATFSVTGQAAEELSGEIDEVVAWRREHQPGGRNAGSVFTNPPGDAAGRLLEAAGAKGLRLGSAVVSDKHANFIGVDAGGSADDVRALIDAARELVEARLGVMLRTEVRFVGFDR